MSKNCFETSVSGYFAINYTIVGDDDMHQITQLWLKNQFKGSAIVGYSNY